MSPHYVTPTYRSGLIFVGDRRVHRACANHSTHTPSTIPSTQSHPSTLSERLLSNIFPRFKVSFLLADCHLVFLDNTCLLWSVQTRPLSYKSGNRLAEGFLLDLFSEKPRFRLNKVVFFTTFRF